MIAVRDALFAVKKAPLLSALSVMTIGFSLFAFGLWALPQRAVAPAPPPSALAGLTAKDKRLQEAPNLQAKLVVLAERAEEALNEAGGHLDDAPRVARLANHFDLLVKDALLRHAHELPADIRADAQVRTAYLGEEDAA